MKGRKAKQRQRRLVATSKRVHGRIPGKAVAPMALSSAQTAGKALVTFSCNSPLHGDCTLYAIGGDPIRGYHVRTLNQSA